MPRHEVPSEQRRFAKQLRRDQTALERHLWHELRARRLDGWKFRRQVPIEGFIVDFVCFEARLIVETDGPLHRRPENQLRDAKRDALLLKQGFRVLRFDSEVALGRMVEDIRHMLAQAPLPTPR